MPQEDIYVSDIVYAYAGDIVKTKTEDGDLIVYGKATGPDLDLDEQICDPNWLREAMPEWMKFGNVREMHQPIAAGVGLELNAEGDDWMLKSRVIDENTAKKVEAGALKGYSVGIKNAKVINDSVAKGGRIVGGTIVEVSLVDRPCNPTAIAGIAKAVGTEWSAVETKVDNPNAPENQMATEDSEWMPEDAYQPGDNADLYPGTHACSVCDGLGKFPDTGETCPHCQGSGIVEHPPAEPGQNEEDAVVMDSKKPDNANASMTQEDIDRHIAGKDSEPDVEKREFTQAERDEAEAKGHAMPGGGFPINTVADLKNAIQSIGRAKDRAAAIAHIKQRATALGREDLIPDSFKTVEGEVEKVEHNDADLEAVRSSMIALIEAELNEMLSGEEEEICDVRNLLTALQIFLDWWQGEANEGETSAPFMETKEDDDTMSYVALGVNADIIKAATSGEESDVAALRDEIRKAIGLSEIAESVETLTKAAERIELLEAELERVKEMAAPGGPVRARTMAQSSKALDAERMQLDAQRFEHLADQVTDPELKNSYRMKALQLNKSAAEILGN